MPNPREDDKDMASVLGDRIGRRIAARRAYLRLRQTDVGERVGVTGVTIGRIEAGESLPSLPTLVAIAVALDLTPGSLLDPDDSERTAA